MIGSLIPAYALVLLVDGAWAQAAGISEVQRPAELSAYHERTRENVSEVLAMREFADLRNDGEGWWVRFLKWAEKVLTEIAKSFRGLPSWLAWVIISWLILALVAILGHFVYVLVGVIGASATRWKSDPAEKGGRGELLGIRELDFDSVNRLAQEYLAAGNWAAATRYLYVAAILWLDRQGWIAFGLSKTNYDYIAELARQPEHRATFRQLTNRFESTVYGGNACTANNCQEMASLFDKLFREATPVVAI
jgi:uncharacterized protein DUF4129